MKASHKHELVLGWFCCCEREGGRRERGERRSHTREMRRGSHLHHPLHHCLQSGAFRIAGSHAYESTVGITLE